MGATQIKECAVVLITHERKVFVGRRKSCFVKGIRRMRLTKTYCDNGTAVSSRCRIFSTFAETLSFENAEVN